MAPLTWFITGCSSGLGETLVEEISSRGDNAIATARKIETIAPHLSKRSNVKCLQLDVSTSSDQIREKVRQALTLFGGIDVLVNNAGYGFAGAFEESSEADAETYMRTALFGPINLVRAILPHFRSKRSGTLVYSCSMYGFAPGAPGGIWYGTAKHGLSGFALSLDAEVRSFGIKTLEIDAGFFKSRLMAKADVDHISKPKIEDYRPMFEAIAGFVSQLAGNEPGDPVKISKVVVDLVRREGIAQGKDVPTRLPLGSDAFDNFSKVTNETRELLSEWESVIKGIDI